MPTLHARNVPDELYQRLKQRAAERQRSLSAEVVLLLELAASRTPGEEGALFERIRRRRAHIAETVGTFPSSVELLRDEILPEYDFSQARPNEYAARYAAGSTVVVLDPDVAAVFSNATEVNDALRALAAIIDRHKRPKPKPSKRRSA